MGTITPPRVDCEIFSEAHKFEKMAMKRKKVTYTKAEELSIDDGFFTNKADRDTDSENHFNANADKALDEFLINFGRKNVAYRDPNFCKTTIKHNNM